MFRIHSYIFFLNMSRRTSEFERVALIRSRWPRGDIEEERPRRRGVRTSLLSPSLPTFFSPLFVTMACFPLCFSLCEFSGIFALSRSCSMMKVLNDTVYPRAFCLRGAAHRKKQVWLPGPRGSRNIHRHHSIRRARTPRVTLGKKINWIGLVSDGFQTSENNCKPYCCPPRYMIVSPHECSETIHRPR